MAILISLYNSSANPIVISDLPTPVTVPPGGSVTAVPPNTQTDVQNSLILREADLQGKLGVIINGNQVKLSNLAIMVGAGGGGGGGVTAVTATAPLTSSGGATPDISTSMATGKLIGRSTAGAGVMEEITVGAGLSLLAGTLTAPGGAAFVDDEIPAGVVDGVNAVFTLANPPTVGSEHLYKNGIRQTPGGDYTIALAVITFTIPPLVGSVILADYRT